MIGSIDGSVTMGQHFHVRVCGIVLCSTVQPSKYLYFSSAGIRLLYSAPFQVFPNSHLSHCSVQYSLPRVFSVLPLVRDRRICHHETSFSRLHLWNLAVQYSLPIVYPFRPLVLAYCTMHPSKCFPFPFTLIRFSISWFQSIQIARDICWHICSIVLLQARECKAPQSVRYIMIVLKQKPIFAAMCNR